MSNTESKHNFCWFTRKDLKEMVINMHETYADFWSLLWVKFQKHWIHRFPIMQLDSIFNYTLPAHIFKTKFSNKGRLCTCLKPNQRLPQMTSLWHHQVYFLQLYSSRATVDITQLFSQEKYLLLSVLVLLTITDKWADVSAAFPGVLKTKKLHQFQLDPTWKLRPR